MGEGTGQRQRVAVMVSVGLSFVSPSRETLTLCSGCKADAAGLWEVGCFCLPGNWILLLFLEVASDWVALSFTLVYTEVAFSWKPPAITSSHFFILSCCVMMLLPFSEAKLEP